MQNTETIFETLFELTGQESGIVIYDDKIIVCNWSYTCPNGGLPMLLEGIGLIQWPTEINLINSRAVDDIRDTLPGAIVQVAPTEIEADDMDIVDDENGDIPALWGYDIGLGSYINMDDNNNLLPTAGTVYEIDGAVVVAPDGWN